MKKVSVITVLLSALILMSCASSPKGKVTKCEPQDTNSVLLCGVVTSEGTGYGKYKGEVSLDGLRTKGLEVQIKDLTTEKTFKVKTLDGGFFYYPKAVAGHKYQIVDVTVRDEKNSAYWTISFPMEQVKPTVCKARQASIMCNIRIQYKKDGPWKWNDPGEEYRVKQVFAFNFPDSAWNRYDFYYSRY